MFAYFVYNLYKLHCNTIYINYEGERKRICLIRKLLLQHNIYAYVSKVERKVLKKGSVPFLFIYPKVKVQYNAGEFMLRVTDIKE